MNLEEKVKQNLILRGFTKEQLLNNRGLIGAAIDEAALEVVKNLTIPVVIGRFCKGQQVEWDGLRYWVVEDNGGDKVLVANSKTQQHEEYNDWWVKRDELNALQLGYTRNIFICFRIFVNL